MSCCASSPVQGAPRGLLMTILWKARQSWLCEIAGSSVSYDLHAKLNVYRRNGVQEYLVWRVNDQAIDWFYLHEGEYLRLAADDTGRIYSRIFPGLWLNVQALLAGDMVAVLATLQEGLQSAEHTQFVTLMQERLTADR